MSRWLETSFLSQA